jgi:hypothetical protein
MERFTVPSAPGKAAKMETTKEAIKATTVRRRGLEAVHVVRRVTRFMRKHGLPKEPPAHKVPRKQTKRGTIITCAFGH